LRFPWPFSCVTSSMPGREGLVQMQREQALGTLAVEVVGVLGKQSRTDCLIVTFPNVCWFCRCGRDFKRETVLPHESHDSYLSFQGTTTGILRFIVQAIAASSDSTRRRGLHCTISSTPLRRYFCQIVLAYETEIPTNSAASLVDKPYLRNRIIILRSHTVFAFFVFGHLSFTCQKLFPEMYY